MGTISYTIPTAGSTSFAVAAPEVDTALSALLTLVNGDLDGANLDASIPGRRLLFEAHAFIGPGVAAGSYLIAQDGSLVSAATTKPVVWIDYDSSTLSVFGRSNTNLIVRSHLAVNGTGPGNTISPGLNAVTVAGTSGQMTWTVGTLEVTGGGFVTPSASSLQAQDGSPVAGVPTGAYAPVVVLSGGSTAANSACCLTVQLFVTTN